MAIQQKFSGINPKKLATLHDSIHEVVEHPYVQTLLGIIGGILCVLVDGRWLVLLFPSASFALHRSKALEGLTKKRAAVLHISIMTMAIVVLFLIGGLVNAYRLPAVTLQQIQAVSLQQVTTVMTEMIKNQQPISSTINPSRETPPKPGGVASSAPKENDERTLKLTADHPFETREATIVAPGRFLQNYNVFYIDTSDFIGGGLLKISIYILPTSTTDGSFDLFPAGIQIPTHGPPTGTLAGSYDVKRGSETRISYHFSRGQVFVLGLGGDWNSSLGASGTVEFQAAVSR